MRNLIASLCLVLLFSSSANAWNYKGHMVVARIAWKDIHQPLHCVALFGDGFPNGDRGGNLSLIKIETRVVQMHSFWDGLLGSGSTPSAIDGAVVEIEQLLNDHPGSIDDALKSNLTAASWAKGAHDLAERVSYADGKLNPVNKSAKAVDADFPTAPSDYARRAGEILEERLAVREAIDGEATKKHVVARLSHYAERRR